MSKVITALSQLDRTRRQKESDEVNPAPGADPSEPGVPVLGFRLSERQVLYALAALALISLAAGIMSVGNVSQVRRTRDFLAGLSSSLAEQDQRIAALEKSFQAVSREQSENLNTARRNLSGVEAQVQQNAQDVNEAEIEMSLLRNDLDAVKQMNQDLIEKIIDLTEEIKIFSSQPY